MSILLVRPKDSADCNHLVSLLDSKGITCMSYLPQVITVGQHVQLWDFTEAFGTEYYVPSQESVESTMQEHAPYVEHLTVNELAVRFKSKL